MGLPLPAVARACLAGTLVAALTTVGHRDEPVRFGATPLGAAAPRVDAEHYLRLEDRAAFGGVYSGVVTDGSLVFATRGQDLEVLAAAASGEPALLATVRMEVPAAARAVDEGLLYLVYEMGPRPIPTTHDLIVYDVSDPRLPLERDWIGLDPSQLHRIAVSGGLVYAVGSGRDEVAIVDARDPDHLALLPAVETDLEANDVALTDGALAVAQGSGGSGALALYSLVEPERPARTATLAMDLAASAVALVDGFALVATEQDLRVVELGAPGGPVERGRVENVYRGFGFAVGDGVAGLLQRPIAVRDRFHVTLLDTSSLPEVAELGQGDLANGLGIAAAGSDLMVADGTVGLRRLAAPDPGSSGPGGGRLVDVATRPTLGLAMGVAMSGDLAFVSDADGELWVLDVSDPAAPLGVSRTTLPFWPGEGFLGHGGGPIALGSGVAFVARLPFHFTEGGVVSVDVTDPSSPTVLGEWSPWDEPPREPPLPEVSPYTSADLAPIVDGERLFLSGRPALTELDISDPASPRLVRYFRIGDDRVNGGDDAGGVTVEGDRAWLAGREAGLLELDLSAGTEITEIGRLATLGEAWDVARVGSHLLVADGSAALTVVDAASGAIVQRTGYMSTAQRLVVAGAGAFVFGTEIIKASDGWPSVQVYGIADPTQPRWLGYTTSFEPGLWNVPWSDVAGEVMVIADGPQGVRVLELSSGGALPPATPVPTFTPVTPGVPSVTPTPVTPPPTRPPGTSWPTSTPLPTSTVREPTVTATVVPRTSPLATPVFLPVARR